MQTPTVVRIAFMAASLATVCAALLPTHDGFLRALSGTMPHAVAFLTLTVLAALAFPKRGYGAVLGVMAGFGGFIELLQLIPLFHRDAALSDWLVDCLAALVGIPLAILARHLFSSINPVTDR